ncbi:MAG: dihydroneopterin aldolase [Blastochloris sp.]|nr:dihydroneopterin aldolase [Blastochloris sp.]
MSDTISIHNLEVWTRIGVPAEERAKAQRLEISVCFKVETVQLAAAHDDLQFTVNYYEVAQSIHRIAGERERLLIETLAEELAATLLKEFGLRQIEIEIRKFIIPECRYISLKIERKAV